MPTGPHRPPKLMGTPEWIFHWRRVREPFFPWLLAVALVAGAFLLGVATLRVRVQVPEKSVPHPASVIFLNDDAQGRALTLQAQEDGPFPSRFVLSQWAGMADLEAAVLRPAGETLPPYVPQVPDLPKETKLPPPLLAATGAAFFPERVVIPTPILDLEKRRTTPVLEPLAGITAETLPRGLPVFQAVVDRPMAAADWRFLVRLDPTGSVVECVSLKKGEEPGAAELAAWLQQIPFPPAPGKPLRWIVLGIHFTNQLTDDTTPH
jgi:hypothetical protein